MPGLTLWLSASADGASRSRFVEAQATMRHASDYETVAKHPAPGLCVGHVAYPGYPVRYLQSNKAMVLLEGRVYNKDKTTVDRELQELADQVYRDAADPVPLLRRWLQEAEGEYLGLMASLEGDDLILFEDVLGCLPAYYWSEEGRFLAARECKFIQAATRETAFDPVGCAQMMWTGHPLGSRTLVKGVSFMPAGEMLRVRRNGGRLRTEQTVLYTYNFDEKDSPAESQETYVSEMADRLIAVCRDWGSQPDAGPTVVSLSGGQDSRSVAAAMVRAGVPIEAVSFTDETELAARDARIAGQLAKALGVAWHLIEVPPADQHAVDRLVWMKDGSNYARMAFILPFLERVTEWYGRDSIYMTGEGGNHVYADVTDRVAPGSFDRLIERMIRRYESLPAEKAEAMAGLERGTLAGELAGVVGRFPEETLRQMNVHYIVYERDRRWTFEAQDRNRFFVWHASPLYAHRFFAYAMRIPDRMKRGYRMLARLQQRLSPACARIPDAFMGATAGSRRFRLKLELRAWSRAMPRPVRRMLRCLGGLNESGFDVPVGDREAVQREVREDTALSAVMDPEELMSLLADCGASQFYNLLTLVTLSRLWRER